MDSEYALGQQYTKILNMARFSICEHYTAFWICQNMPWVLNMPEFWIWQGSVYARVTQGSKYAIIPLNMSEWDVSMLEYVWIFYNRQYSEYVSYNT